MGSYDRAITTFNPEGHLKQVQYASEAVKRGNTAVAIRGKNAVIIGVEKKAASKLQDSRTAHKVCQVDDHIYLAFAGLMADARVLVNYARLHCQNFRLDYEDPISTENLARYIAQVQQKCTQKGGTRPYGVMTIIGGFDTDGTPHLYSTDPGGVFRGWRAIATGRHFKTVREYLEVHYEEDLEEKEALALCVRALLEVVDSGARNLEVREGVTDVMTCRSMCGFPDVWLSRWLYREDDAALP